MGLESSRDHRGGSQVGAKWDAQITQLSEIRLGPLPIESMHSRIRVGLLRNINMVVAASPQFP